MKFIQAHWPAPKNILALTTTRLDGHSTGIYAGLNLGDHVQDDAKKVSDNRIALQNTLSLTSAPHWLKQTHGTDVVELPHTSIPKADACFTRAPQVCCAILTADCLPILLCNKAGTIVAGIHGGWRSLAGGIIEKTLKAMAFPPQEILAWMGPAIGPQHFQVGGEVREQFIQQDNHLDEAFCPDSSSRYMANIFTIARLQLERLGVKQIFGGDYCTYSDAQRFYSYRRDGETGRLASLICMK